MLGEFKMILFDTNIFIEIYRENQKVIKETKLIGVNNIAISAVTACELIYGALNKSDLKTIIKDIESVEVILIDKEISSYSIELLKRYSLSHKLSLPDSLIASTSIFYNLQLFTLNIKDFKYIENIRLYEINNKII